MTAPQSTLSQRLKDHAIPGVVFFVWIGIVVFAYVLSQRTGADLPLCTLRRTTGVPCPTCGGTRATMSLFSGHPARALAFNPVVTVFVIVAPLWWLSRLLKPPPPWSPSRRRVASVIAWVLVLGNWAYVIWHEASIRAG
ncbi:MAG: DUF2752 domain-containing protein [Phycisphaerales bacterium]|nr:DUF2752 domain-containing protein [Phycisphaerales bacterium]